MQRAFQRPQRSDAAPRIADASGWLDTALWVTAIVFTVLGTLLMVALLRQRNGSDPWARIDVYTGGFMIVGGLAGIVQATTFVRSALRSVSGVGEAEVQLWRPLPISGGEPLQLVAVGPPRWDEPPAGVDRNAPLRFAFTRGGAN